MFTRGFDYIIFIVCAWVDQRKKIRKRRKENTTDERYLLFNIFLKYE